MTEHIWFMDGHCETDVVHYGVKGMRWGIRRALRLRKRQREQKREEKRSLTTDYFTDEQYDNGPVKKLSEFKRIKPETFSVAMHKCNKRVTPDDDDDGYFGRTDNQANVAMAMEMRRRGYDVIARQSDIPNSDIGISAFFKEPKLKSVGEIASDEPYSKTRKQLRDGILKEGDSTGFISINRPDQCYSEIFNYEVKNNRLHLFEGIEELNGSEAMQMFDNAENEYMQYMRTDNLELKDDVGKIVMDRG